MTELSKHGIDPQRMADLRGRAASRLTGAAATKGSTAKAADALAVLHALASSPETASDALALLHELQVHQVELDLQAQELQESRAELESALRRHIERYDLQPFGCFTVDARLIVHELNQTGAEMLGIGPDQAHGMGLDAFLCAESAHGLKSAIAMLGEGLRQPTILLQLCARNEPERPVLANIGVDAVANRYLLSLTGTADEAQHPRRGA
jgi:hypothetical protein